MASRSEKPERPEASLENFLNASTASIASELHPDRNEDAILADIEHGIFGVFDGMGGHAAGAEAARIARDVIAERLLPETDTLGMRDVLDDAMRAANEAILRYAREHPEAKGMGTTATVARLIKHSGDKWDAVIGSIGDSRAYRIRRGGSVLEHMTLDDSLAAKNNEEGEARRIQLALSNATRKSDLSPSDLPYFMHRNVIKQCLGKPDPAMHYHIIPVAKDETLLLTSDGVHDNLTDKEILEASASADSLIQKALERSREKHDRAKPDDMSVVVIGVR